MPAIAACGDDDEPDGGGPTAAAEGASLPESGEVVFFGLSRQNPYVVQMYEGAKAQAEELGWTVRYVENNNNQQQQDNQVTQFLGSGDKPLGVIQSPLDVRAASTSMLAITKAEHPLVIINQVPGDDQKELFTAYAGTDDVLSGETAAELLAEKAEEEGFELGDGIILGSPAGSKSADDRKSGFESKLKELAPGARILDYYNVPGFGPAEGYEIASQVIPPNLEDLSWVYGVNDAVALGAIRALEEQDKTPGEDVLLVGATCLGPETNQAVKDGKLVGTAVQSPFVEGRLAVVALAEYLSTGEVTDGETVAEATGPPATDVAPHKFNYMPLPKVPNTRTGFDDTKVWGRTAEDLCTYG